MKHQLESFETVANVKILRCSECELEFGATQWSVNCIFVKMFEQVTECAQDLVDVLSKEANSGRSFDLKE